MIGRILDAGTAFVQRLPSPIQPALQEQVYEPAVLQQSALVWQTWLPMLHSSASKRTFPSIKMEFWCAQYVSYFIGANLPRGHVILPALYRIALLFSVPRSHWL